MTSPINKTKLGMVKKNILTFLEKNKRSKVFDIELAMSRGNLRASVSSLVSQGYIMRVKETAFDGVAITNAGREAIGAEVLDEHLQRPTRICNASQRLPLDHVKDVCMGRVGLARFGVAGRVGGAA